MSVTSDFWKAMNQSGATVSNAGSSGKKASGGGVSSGGFSSGTSTKKKKKSITEEFWEAMGDDDIAPVKSSVASRVQARANGGKKDDEEEQKKGWFQKGLFEDGYDIGDITKTILGTGADILEDLGAGVAEIPEKVADAAAMIAPYFAQSQINQAAYSTMDKNLLKTAKEFDLKEEKKKADKWVAKDLYDGKEVAHSILNPVTDGVSAMIGQEYETASVLGDKADSTVQSGGQLLATMGLQAVGVPWFVTTGVTSFGAEAENALNQDATHEEAMGSAAISAAAEILTEKIGGGIKFGGKAWDDALSKMFARKIANKVGRTAARLGVDVAGEAGEEVLSQFASNIGSSLYRDESMQEILWSEQAFDEYLDAAIGGGLLGGVSGGFKAVNSSRKGVDYVSELTANEQQVVDKVYKDRVAEAEKEGKVTEKEKSKIYDRVLSDMEKGYISTDTIEEVLGGDTYKFYRGTVDSEDSILKEYDELGKKQNATLAEQSRYSELTQQVKDIKENSQRNNLKTQLGDEVFSLVQGDRLAESYNERARTGQKFEADVTKYDTKQQAVVQKAIDSGILNNSNRTHEFVDFVSKISADTGVLFDFSNTAKIREAGFAVEGQTVDGFITKDGITVNIDSPKSRQFVVGHEITHALEGTELYDALRKSVFDYAKMKNQYGVRMESIQKRYKEGTDFEAELTADLVGEYIFSDTDFIKNLSTQNRNVFQKVYDEIKYLCKVATAGSKEARELEKVKRAFEKAYREGGKTQGDTKYSVSDSAGKELTVEQQEYFKDSKMRDENGNLKVMYHGSQDAGFHVFDSSMSDDGTSFFFVDRNEVAASYSGTTETYEAKTFNTVEDLENFFEEIGAEGYEIVEENGRLALYHDGDHVVETDDAQGIYEEFCWYEGVGEGDANYKVYLNLKNPLEVDAQGRNWDMVGREFSQELYDKYMTLTDTEKSALVDATKWDDFGTFRDEVNEAVEAASNPARYGGYVDDNSKAIASAVNKLRNSKGELDMYTLHYFATENFAEDVIREDATVWLKTRDYAQKAKSEGYDGVIFKNIVDVGAYGGDYNPATVAIAFDSNQIKSVANAKPTADPDIRYSLSDSNGRELSKEQSEYFKDSKVRDKNGSLQVMYHGSPESFTVFDKKKAKSSGLYGKGFYFTNSDAHAKQYGNTYEVYLNITNPLQNGTNDITKDQLRAFVEAIAEDEDYGIENYGYEATVDSVTNNVFGKGDFSMLMDINVTCVGNMVEAIELFNKVNGTDYNGIIAPTETVAFYPEQIKEVANQKPTADKDIRFSLSKPVEETKNLMALHNLTSEKLMKSLKLGGLPMPSVAIAKAKDGHSEFGEISLILPRETIDPETSSRNKLYSGDAWTPTYPKVDYKLNSKVLKQVIDKINGLVPANIQEFGRLHLDSDNMEDTLNRYNGDMVDAFKDNDALKYAYLMEAEADVQLPMKEKNISYHGRVDNGAIVKVAEAIPLDELKKAMNSGYEKVRELEPTVRKAVSEYMLDTYGYDPELIKLMSPEEELSYSDLDEYVTGAIKYHRNGIEQTVDTRPARELIRDMTVQYSYEEWLTKLFSGIVEKEGIRNDKDYFTPSGNRRSFEALHYEHNLENVIKAMREKGEKGIGFGGGSIFGAATTAFSSVDEMKQASDRLQHMSEEEYQDIKDGFTKRFFDLASSLPKSKNSWTATDDAANTLTEAVAKHQTKRGIANYLRRELDGWANYSPQVVDDLIELVNDIRSMPTGYFEAKPQRAVGFDEVGVFVIPYDADVKLKQELLNRGYSIAEYDPKVEGDRQRVVNQFEEYKFSLSNVGEQHTPDSLSALRLDTEEDIAPTISEEETVAKNATTEDFSDVAVTAAEMREMFPDDGDTPQVELDNLRYTNEALENRMLKMAEDEDFTDLETVNDEWMAVQARMAVLEAELAESETDRISSLDDSDIPPEMDAPLSMTSDNYDPFGETTVYDIDRSTRSYSDRNPGARHFLEEAALGFAYDVNNSTHGERWYNDQLYYESGGEKGFGGTSRHTTSDIAELKDAYGYTWDELLKAANDVANGDFRSVAAKRVEYLCHKRLLEGYTDVDGRPIPANQEYISFLNETFANQQAQTQFDSFMETADMYAPEDIAPTPAKTLKEATPDTMQTPIYESKEKGVLKGQTTMFEDKQKKPVGGKTAKVLTEEPKVNKKSNKIWSMVKEHFFDNGMVFEDVSKKTGNRELEGKWNFIRYSRARAQGLIGKGAEGVRSLKDIKKEVDKSGKTEAFFDYLYHRHNEDRMSLEDRFGVPNKAVYGDHVTAPLSRAIYSQLEKANPEFKQWANDIYSYNKHLRSLLVENDVISKETAELWEKMYPHYVPVGRVDQNGFNVSVPLDSRKTGVNNPVKRATGGNQNMRPLFNVMAERTTQTYRAIARNRFGIELKNTLGSDVGKNAQNVDEVIDSLSDDNVLLKPGVNGESPTFAVFENGERVEFGITEEMYNALKPTSEGLMYRNKVLSGASSVFRGLTTQYSIPFMATNAIKDAQDVLINSQHPLRTYANMPRAQFQIAARGKWYQEYMANGGEDNTYFDTETGSFDENVFKNGFDFITAPVTMANNFIEMTPRLAEYIASREAGRSVEVSMLDAARVTTNFAAGGDITKFANANGATFLNASVQGAVQQVRNFREAYHKGFVGWVGLAARFAVAGLPAILLNNMLWDDDEEYEELADYVKQDYYVIGKYDDGKFIRIPKGRTVAVIQNAIEQVQNAATGDDEVDLASFLKLAVNNLAPNNPLTNNIVAPIGQVMTNRTWYGEELVDYYMQQLPEMEQYDENTSTFSVELSKKINELTGAEISPVKIDYLLNQYSGGIGDVLLPMSTPKAEHGDDSTWGNITAPLKDKFTTDSVLNSKRNAEYKEAKNAAHKAAKSVNATDEDILRSQYFYAKSDEMSALYDQKREIQNSDLSDAEKYEKAREIQEKINAIAEEALNDNVNVNIDGYYATVGDKRFDYSDYKGKWYEIEGDYLEKEQNAVKRYGITPSDYWNNTDLYYDADYYFKYSPQLEDVSKNVFDGKWFAGYAAEVSQIKGDDLNGDGKSDSGTKKKKVFSYIDGLDVDDIEKKILRKMSYPSEDKYNYEIIEYLNNRDDISYDQMKTILEALDFTVDDEGYINW